NIVKTIQGILKVVSQKNDSKKKLFIISVMRPYSPIFKIFSNKKIARHYLPSTFNLDENINFV
ncbi:hypothetical protein KKP88_00290, partial [Methanothermococcus sp. SCGC AD-155-K20]|nr:hypothetical protein [Methanothermococcus sp. SCGC AD-155-K20]